MFAGIDSQKRLFKGYGNFPQGICNIFNILEGSESMKYLEGLNWIPRSLRYLGRFPCVWFPNHSWDATSLLGDTT